MPNQPSHERSPVAFDDEAYPRLRFENIRNPLKVVVGQVRFPPAYRLGDPAVQGTLQQALADDFPRPLDPVQEISFAFTPQGPTTPQVEQTAIRFGDQTGRRVSAIGVAMASFETTDYVGWEDFQSNLARILGLIGEHAAPTEYVRFGLRYVDELTVEGARTIGDWANIIAEPVIGPLDSLSRDDRVVETTQMSRVIIGEDEVRFRHGYIRRQGDDGTETSIYLLDTDMATTTPHPWDRDELLQRAARYHRWMTNIFGRSLTPEGLRQLGGEVR